MTRVLTIFAMFVFLIPGSVPAQEQSLSCGVAAGFPPYQFTLDGEPTGFDVDVARAVCARLGKEAIFEQRNWDDVVNMLLYGRIDLVAGMEVNDFRFDYFEFSTPYAKRHDVVFVPANSTVAGVEDLFGLIITGDRHSFLELHWKEQGIFQNIRIMQTGTKEESMTLLGQGRTAAAIMPLEVGWYLAAQQGIDVRVLVNPDPGSDVAIALRKGQPELLLKINDALRDMEAEGELDALQRKWFCSENAARPQ
ncbi:MAG: transporter substrate-binding domain-containing protein [Desulfomicrobium sp.]|nr:transporter substrate-binding domain-containing protein [Desulfomicrobium sp.]